MENNILPNWVKNCLVTDVQTVEEFAHRYMKPERFTSRGADYVNSIISNMNEQIKKYGYCAISKYSSVTNEFITFSL